MIQTELCPECGSEETYKTSVPGVRVCEECGSFFEEDLPDDRERFSRIEPARAD